MLRVSSDSWPGGGLDAGIGGVLPPLGADSSDDPANSGKDDHEVCYTCGCKLPYERHGDPANIVEEDLKKAGQTDTIDKAGVATAKENLLELIRLQEDAGDLGRPKQDYNE